MQKFQILEKKVPKISEVLKWSEMNFCAMKELSKVIFLLTSFFSSIKYGGGNMQKFQILEKNIPKLFGVLKWSEMDFAL